MSKSGQDNKNSNSGLQKQINDLRIRIHAQRNENTILKTKYNKMVSQHENFNKQFQILQNTKDAEEFELIEEKKNYQNKQKQQVMSKIEAGGEMVQFCCKCGEVNPKFKGYCGNCVKMLKDQYVEKLEWYSPIAKDYDNKLQSTLNYKQKIQLLEKRAQQNLIQEKNDPEIESLIQEINQLKQQIELEKFELELKKQEWNRKIQDQENYRELVVAQKLKKQNKKEKYEVKIEQENIKQKELKNTIEESKKYLLSKRRDITSIQT